jgi:wobble nucleotide-excising tRNase
VGTNWDKNHDITLGLLKRLEPNDRDYDNQRITALEFQGEKMLKNQEDTKGQVEKLAELQKKTSNAVLLFSKILALTFLLTLGNIVGFIRLNQRINTLESQIKNKHATFETLDNKIKELEKKIPAQEKINNSELQMNQISR